MQEIYNEIFTFFRYPLTMTTQLPLPIHQVDDETLENFYAEHSPVLLDSLRQNFDHVSQPFFYIWGGKVVVKAIY